MADNDLLVIDDNVLRGMMSDVRFTSAFPCLAQGKRKLELGPASGCNRCRRSRRNAQQNVMAQVRNCIAGLPNNKRQELKRLCNVRQMRVVRANARGGRVRVTF